MTRRAFSVARRNRPACGGGFRTRATGFSHPPLGGEARFAPANEKVRGTFSSAERPEPAKGSQIRTADLGRGRGGNGDLRALAALLFLWALCAFAMRFA